jgi:hypothetical protein
VHQRVVGGLLGKVIELRTGDRPEQPSSTSELMNRNAQKQVMKRRDRTVVSWVPGCKLLHPSI